MQSVSTERAFKIDRIAASPGIAIRAVAQTYSQCDPVCGEPEMSNSAQDHVGALFAAPAPLADEKDGSGRRLVWLSVMAVFLVCVSVALMVAPRKHPDTGAVEASTVSVPSNLPQNLVVPDADWDARFIEDITDRALFELRR